MLYHEVQEVFVEALAKDVGMKIKPDNVLDLLLEYVSNKYVHYHMHPLAQGTLEGVTVVMDNISQVAAVEYLERLNKKEGQLPVIF